jgi:hypothetical protein
VIEEDHGPIEIGPFEITYLPLAHSIAEGNALLIETPHGRVFHTGDWKLDEEPIIGEPTTEAELREIGDEGVLALVCDSTNVFNPAASGSEGAVQRCCWRKSASTRAGACWSPPLPPTSRGCRRWAKWRRKPAGAVRCRALARPDHRGGTGQAATCPFPALVDFDTQWACRAAKC